MTIKKYVNIAKKKLYPLNRSLTGKGTKKTLGILKKELPKLVIKRIKSGTNVFDWKILEITGLSLGRFDSYRILHLVNYSGRPARSTHLTF